MEKEYFYLNGDVKIGPLSLDALKSAPVSLTTFVWNNSLPDWVEAGSLPELAAIFAPAPPPPPPPAPNYNPNNYATGGNINNPQKPPMPESYLVWTVLTTIFCCWPIGIFSIIYAAKVSSAYHIGDYEGSMKASANAKKIMIVNICTGILIYVISSIVFAIAGFASLSALDF